MPGHSDTDEPYATPRTMSSPPSPAIRRTMQGNRGRNTAPEVAVRSLLHANGLRFRVCAPLPIDRRRSADIVFTRAGLFVFIDGCFWHGCPDHYVAPVTNSGFWAQKVKGNIARDLDTTARLNSAGFVVIRYWEHENPQSVATDIRSQYLDLVARQQ